MINILWGWMELCIHLYRLQPHSPYILKTCYFFFIGCKHVLGLTSIPLIKNFLPCGFLFTVNVSLALKRLFLSSA